MNNLRMNYRYRDADNYKEFGSVVFSNPRGLTMEEATRHKSPQDFYLTLGCLAATHNLAPL
ncbi:hypothetical protein ACPUEN_04335 [Algoriphagus yeomjeoni]|uniref:hypothetical protein n=1 Tax=Algoriphagus yeomjeoni TaxID=291403 RepID=UPI003CE5841B